MAWCIMLHMDCCTWWQAEQCLLLFQFTVDGHPHILVKCPAINIRCFLTMCKNGVGSGLPWGVPLSCIISCFLIIGKVFKSSFRMCVYTSANLWSQEEMNPIILVTLVTLMWTLASYINMGVDAHPSQKGLCCVELGFEAPCILFTALYRL
jgi:hypothetical protein